METKPHFAFFTILPPMKGGFAFFARIYKICNQEREGERGEGGDKIQSDESIIKMYECSRSSTAGE